MITFLITFILLVAAIFLAVVAWPITLLLIIAGLIVVVGYMLLIWGGTIGPVILLLGGICIVGLAIEPATKRWPILLKKL